jgi:thioredoxin reductase (NADPH)
MKNFFNIKDIKYDYDIVIIGGGPAGSVAGMYAARDAYSTLVMEMNTPGGLMGFTNLVENHPGMPHALDGYTLSELYYSHAVQFGAVFKNLACSRIEEAGDNSFLVFTEQLKEPIKAKAVIIATGSSPKKLGCRGEENFIGNGVSYCATCDGHFYDGKVVAAVGGGNTALSEANYLTRFADKVYLIHRRDEFRGDIFSVKQVKENPEIEILYSSVIVGIDGKKTVEFVEVKNLKTGAVETISAAGVFIFVGQSPHTEQFKGLINLDELGYIAADESTRTNIKGIFAAGDVRAKHIRQIATAVSDAVVAVKQAEEYLVSLKG